MFVRSQTQTQINFSFHVNFPESRINGFHEKKSDLKRFYWFYRFYWFAFDKFLGRCLTTSSAPETHFYNKSWVRFLPLHKGKFDPPRGELLPLGGMLTLS
jgi:hypothetical protein